jgi:hypothetical protein
MCTTPVKLEATNFFDYDMMELHVYGGILSMLKFTLKSSKGGEEPPTEASMAYCSGTNLAHECYHNNVEGVIGAEN